MKRNDMEYIGKLYGKLGPNQYFYTGKTSNDWDRIEQEITRLKEELGNHFQQLCDKQHDLGIKDMKIQQLEAVISQLKERIDNHNSTVDKFTDEI